MKSPYRKVLIPRTVQNPSIGIERLRRRQTNIKNNGVCRPGAYNRCHNNNKNTERFGVSLLCETRQRPPLKTKTSSSIQVESSTCTSSRQDQFLYQGGLEHARRTVQASLVVGCFRHEYQLETISNPELFYRPLRFHGS